ncbi:MAG: DeoR/GlpR family DNA-binding transcription regulator [Lachnospiraceae bacterium]|nr:DeoR/GlpR family DNA-binding transcription regulator [Lachnospiraceae bacterium]
MDTMEERREAIVALVNERSSITFAEIKKELQNVSDMTIRTDLKALDKAKRIVRIHGGAKSVENVIGNDDLLGRRAVRNVEAKQIIARKATSLVRPNTTVFIDSGSTTTEFANIFPDVNCVIFTNSLSCAVELCRLTNARVYVLGGLMNRNSLSAVGHAVLQEMEPVNFDAAFLGTTSFTYDLGFTCESAEDNAVKRAALSKAAQTVVLMDSSKIGRRGSFTMCGLDKVTDIVMDDNVPEEFRQECVKNHVSIY